MGARAARSEGGHISITAWSALRQGRHLVAGAAHPAARLCAFHPGPTQAPPLPTPTRRTCSFTPLGAPHTRGARPDSWM